MTELQVYDKIKKLLLDRGYYVLDDRIPLEEFKYLISLGFTILYAKFSPHKGFRWNKGYYPGYVAMKIDNKILDGIEDDILYDEIKHISYHPETIVIFANTKLLWKDYLSKFCAS